MRHFISIRGTNYGNGDVIPPSKTACDAHQAVNDHLISQFGRLGEASGVSFLLPPQGVRIRVRESIQALFSPSSSEDTIDPGDYEVVYVGIRQVDGESVFAITLRSIPKRRVMVFYAGYPNNEILDWRVVEKLPD